MLLMTIVVVLVLILFKDKIRMYFKAQEVLQKANVYNITDVAVKCYNAIISTDDDYIPSQECSNMVDSYNEKVLRWNNLIKEYRDINCKDFTDQAEAQDFYDYVSGELAGGFYAYRKVIVGVKPDDTEHFAFATTNKFDGHCRHDPYGLDTNGDCNACENYGQKP